jgi:hypothetical protein
MHARTLLLCREAVGVTTRYQNERKFGHWRQLPAGGRLYWIDVAGKTNRRARYLKEVDADEKIVRFWQEIYDDQGRLVAIHEKYPVDLGHQPAQGQTR